MSVLSITLLHAAVLRSVLGIFLHVVHHRIRDHSGCSHRVTHMLGKSHFTASHFPSTAIASGKQELFRAITFRHAGRSPHLALGCRLERRDHRLDGVDTALWGSLDKSEIQ